MPAVIMSGRPPSAQEVWVLEVEPQHVLRIADIVDASFIQASRDPDDVAKKNTIPPYLLFTPSTTTAAAAENRNDSQRTLPTEFFKYITRQFFVPNCCHSADWLVWRVWKQFAESPSRLDDVVLKIVATPKSLEGSLAAALFSASGERLALQASAKGYTHLLQVVYVSEGLFRWGVCTSAFASEHLLTNEALAAALQVSREVVGASALPPVCRAYYKVKELLEQQLPQNFGWSLPDPLTCVSCDVGSAPGGWTQLLALHSARVISIDPGKLDPAVEALPNVTYIPQTLQNSNVEAVLGSVAPSPLTLKLVVCDVNFEPRETAKMLCDHLLPLLDGMACPCAAAGSSSYILLTLKLLKNPKQSLIDRVVAGVLDIFKRSSGMHADCWSHKLVHLTANSKNERTLCLRLH